MGERLVRGSRVAYVAAAYAFIVGVLVRILFVGLALFAGQATWTLLTKWGHIVGTFLLAMLVLSFTGRLPRSDKILTAIVFVFLLVQTEVFAAVRNAVPFFAAFHSVLAFVIFALATILAIRGRGHMKGPAWDEVPLLRPGANVIPHTRGVGEALHNEPTVGRALSNARRT